MIFEQLRLRINKYIKEEYLIYYIEEIQINPYEKKNIHKDYIKHLINAGVLKGIKQNIIHYL